MLLIAETAAASVGWNILGLEWKDLIPIIISVIALFLTVAQYFGEYKRKKKQDTLEAYDKLQTEVFTPLNAIRKQYPTMPLTYSFDKRADVTSYLAKIERFCVGVNLGIYDLNTLMRCGGAYFVRQYLYLEPLIKEKRKRNNGGAHYDEYENVVRKLKYQYDSESDNIDWEWMATPAANADKTEK